MPRKAKPAPTPPPAPQTEALQKVDFSGGATAPAPKRRPIILDLTLNEEEQVALEKREWEHVRDNKVFRLAFEGDPYNLNAQYSGLFRLKTMGIPDPMLKRVAVQESLVALIILARQHHMAPFGREQKDRRSLGFKVVFQEGFLEKLDEQQKSQWEERAKQAARLLRSCGKKDGWDKKRRCSLGSWFKQTVKSALTVGRIATEMIYDDDGQFHSFRPMDAGTIHPAIKTSEGGEQVRHRSQDLLRRFYGDPDIEIPETDGDYWSTYDWDQYDWVQVIDGQPVQVFTDEQMVVRNFYETPDVEWYGFPCTPIDMAISEVLTRLSITAWNRIYFQNGRAAKGMLIIQSEEADPAMLAQIRQQFMAAINGVQSAWRMPIFAVPPDNQVTWQPIDSSSRDMEFQYLSDNNTRHILAAFQVSPDELAAMSHLSRGTASQTLSEGNNEYKLEAARDVGIRPLIANFEDYINDEIWPRLDPELSKCAKIELRGMDAMSKDEEDAYEERQQQITGTYNDTRNRREERPLPKHLAGDVPLNQVWGAQAQAFVPVGTILEDLLGIQDAKQDLRFAYVRDPFYWQQQEALMGQLQMVLQPPFTALAPLQLPRLLVAIFQIPPEQAQALTQQMLAEAQQAMLAQQQAAMGGGQDPNGAPPEDGEQEQGPPQGQPAQKSEPFAFLKHRQNFILGLGQVLPPAKRAN